MRGRLIAAAIIGMLVVGVSSCGGGSGRSSAGGSTPMRAKIPRVPLKAGENPVNQALTGQTKKRGGTLSVHSSTDFRHLDPGSSYFSLDYGIDYVTQRPLFAYLPNAEARLTADLATAIPTIANRGITNVFTILTGSGRSA